MLTQQEKQRSYILYLVMFYNASKHRYEVITMTKTKTYTAQELANLAGVTRQSIYRIIKKKHINAVRVNGVNMYSEQAKRQILGHYGQNETTATIDAEETEETNNKLQIENKALQSELKHLKEFNEILKSELDIKNTQILALSKQLQATTQLIDQAQTLNLLDKPKPSKSSAESEHTEQSSQKQAENHTQKDTDKPGKSWFTRIFKR